MQIEPDGSPASGHGAAMTISGEHLLALSGRDGRGRAFRCSSIQRAEMDGIAGSALGYGRIDLDVSASAVLPGALTVRALLDRDLVGGRAGPLATLAVRPAKNRGDQLVVGQSL